ncbi:MAG: ComF family protein [Formivibrio sp.]|nr:ComF family protein [Formivibrio sp.]
MCGNCLKTPPHFDSTHAAFLYHGVLAQLIPAAKFGARWSLFPALARLMLPTLQQVPRPDLLIPLPLHAQRLKERGFNQALEIAKPLVRSLSLPLEHTLLQRTRDTEHQARLSEKARHRNMRKAFVARGDLSGQRIALVDDVMTTGASLDAAARALKQAGAARVDCWILARTP